MYGWMDVDTCMDGWMDGRWVEFSDPQTLLMQRKNLIGRDECRSKFVAYGWMDGWANLFHPLKPAQEWCFKVFMHTYGDSPLISLCIMGIWNIRVRVLCYIFFTIIYSIYYTILKVSVRTYSGWMDGWMGAKQIRFKSLCAHLGWMDGWNIKIV